VVGAGFFEEAETVASERPIFILVATHARERYQFSRETARDAGILVSMRFMPAFPGCLHAVIAAEFLISAGFTVLWR
jgi:hypothetical protein